MTLRELIRIRDTWQKFAKESESKSLAFHELQAPRTAEYEAGLSAAFFECAETLDLFIRDQGGPDA